MNKKLNIQKWREKHNLTREDLASKVGVSAMSIYRWETGKAEPSRLAKRNLEEVMKKLKKS